jgi:hypothetical protein
MRQKKKMRESREIVIKSKEIKLLLFTSDEIIFIESQGNLHKNNYNKITWQDDRM